MKLLYVVTAKDLSALESGYSNEVTARVPGDPQSKIGHDNLSNEINSYELSQNYPNPFNPNTTIKYSLGNSSQVLIDVFDELGNKIVSLVNEEKQR